MDAEVYLGMIALGLLGLVVIGVPALLVGQARLRRRVAALEAALGARDTPQATAKAEPEATPAPDPVAGAPRHDRKRRG
ncbi:MAG: hypothetical protein U5K36_03540 [Roseovarius sp.]|nr:hypothetical protein [Roseovarius sp.]